MDPMITPTPTPGMSPTGPAPSGQGSAPSSTPVGGDTEFSSMATPASSAPASSVPPTSPVASASPSPTTVDSTNPSPTPVPSPVNPVFQPNRNRVAATDPIMMPEPAPEPDPVEEELKAPMKAAGPVPGSIGSAVSGGPASNANADAPIQGGNPFNNDPKMTTPNVAFNDPAIQENTMVGGPVSGAPKPKRNKTTMIILFVVLGLIVAVLAGVLVMQLMSGNGSSASGNTGNETSKVDDNSNNDDGNTPVSGNNNETDANDIMLSCSRPMTEVELANFADAASGDVAISATFDEEEMLKEVSMVKSVSYGEEATAELEEVSSDSAEASDLTEENAALYELPMNDNGKLLVSLDIVQMNYESLEYTCEVL